MAKTIPITPFESKPLILGDEEARTLGIPMNVNVFQRPLTPETSNQEAALNCRALFMQLSDAMLAMKQTGERPLIALNNLDSASLGLINQTLGEGEMSIRILENDEGQYDEIRIVETVFVGVWRVQYFKNNVAIADQIEVGPIPACCYTSSMRHATRTLHDEIEFPDDAMNSPAVLAELREVTAKWKAGDPIYTVNLSHLPITPADNKIINDTLGLGSVYMISKGMGNSHISSTHIPNVWRVQYYNNAKTSLLILNTVVITTMPEEAMASPEDLDASQERIREYVDWLTESWELPAL